MHWSHEHNSLMQHSSILIGLELECNLLRSTDWIVVQRRFQHEKKTVGSLMYSRGESHFFTHTPAIISDKERNFHVPPLCPINVKIFNGFLFFIQFLFGFSSLTNQSFATIQSSRLISEFAQQRQYFRYFRQIVDVIRMQTNRSIVCIVQRTKK